MNPMRRTTPDSEAIVSSEDERPWPAAPVFGTLPRKENGGVSGFGGGIWAQKRGSMKMDMAARNNAANAVREGRFAVGNAPATLLRSGSTPSPAASESSAVLPFSIPLQPTMKQGRSLSHSQGQREPLTHHTSGSVHAPNLPLGLLSEEVDTETESDSGGPLTQTTSHPPIGTLHRTATYGTAYDTMRFAQGSGERGIGGRAKAGSRSDRGLEGSVGHMSPDHTHRRLWESHLGWEDLPSINESRRHSLADIPTRRGSLSGGDTNATGQMGGGPHWPSTSNAFDYRPDEHTFYTPSSTNDARTDLVDPSTMRATDRDDTGGVLDVPSMYRVPFIEIADHERSEADRRAAAGAPNPPMGPPNRPRKQLFVVSFKCSRVDVFYLLDNTGLFIKEGDIVIVEADRGQDLGTVQHANVTNDEARLYRRKYGEEQYKWLMMFSQNNARGNINPNAQIYGENQAARSNLLANAPAAMQGVPRDSNNTIKPKAIKRLASSHEIRMLGEKEGNEAKAKRTCQQKVNHLHLDMEILDAEWQWDFQKLIFYYYADHYINFKDLITELYRIYKTRIWLSAINPASFSQHAHGQPPSAIGPGAVTNQQSGNTSYTMSYGADPDPYGAVPPYRINYPTYTPNYPGIPGVTNSFPQGGPGGFAPGMMAQGTAAPSLPPGVPSTGSPEDYNYYYDRSGGEDVTAPRALPGPGNYGSIASPTAGAFYPPGYPPNMPAMHPNMHNNGFGGAGIPPMGRYGPIGGRAPSNGHSGGHEAPPSSGQGYPFGQPVQSFGGPPSGPGALGQSNVNPTNGSRHAVGIGPGDNPLMASRARPSAPTSAFAGEALQEYMQSISLQGSSKVPHGERPRDN